MYKAVERFDITRGVQLQMYATWWIRERILQRFKNIKDEQAYLEDRTNGLLVGGMVDDRRWETEKSPERYDVRKICPKMGTKCLARHRRVGKMAFIEVNSTKFLHTPSFHRCWLPPVESLLATPC